jgi:hypothetical protein
MTLAFNILTLAYQLTNGLFFFLGCLTKSKNPVDCFSAEIFFPKPSIVDDDF